MTIIYIVIFFRQKTYPKLLKNLTKHFPKNCIMLSIESPVYVARAAAKLVISSSEYICLVLKTMCLQSAFSRMWSHTSSPNSNCKKDFLLAVLYLIYFVSSVIISKSFFLSLLLSFPFFWMALNLLHRNVCVSVYFLYFISFNWNSCTYNTYAQI